MKIAVMGAAGRMGRALTKAVVAHKNTELVGGTEPKGSEFVGADLGALNSLGNLGLPITDDPLPLFTKAEAILDFTRPRPTLEFAELAAQARIVHVIGTTGFNDEELKKLEAASAHSTIIKAGNMSLGVNLLTALTKQVASVLGDDYDIEIMEMHHRHKVDAPSGTSLMLGGAAAEGRGIKLSDNQIRTRDGVTGERPLGRIGFANIRGGSVVGDHTVIFAGPGERIELVHKADNREIYSNGAVKAALWGKGKKPGLYTMLDVLGLG